MPGLDALPLPAREEVVQLLRPPTHKGNYPRRRRWAGALWALPQVSQGTLAALKELRLPIGRFATICVQDAVRQAHALRRAWDLGTLRLVGRGVTDLSALASCTKLHTLNFTACRGVTDLSALANCAAVRTLELMACSDFTDVSPLTCGLRDTAIAQPLGLPCSD